MTQYFLPCSCFLIHKEQKGTYDRVNYLFDELDLDTWIIMFKSGKEPIEYSYLTTIGFLHEQTLSKDSIFVHFYHIRYIRTIGFIIETC